MSDLIEKLRSTSLFYGGNAPFIEDLYETFLVDPGSVPDAWRTLFDQLPRVDENTQADTSHQRVRETLFNLNREQCGRAAARTSGLSANAAAKQASVLRLINAFRVRGHQNADLDPIKLRDIEPLDELSLRYHELNDEDLDTIFNTGSLYSEDRLTLREILSLVREVYTGSVGSEYMHITNTEEKRWIQQRLETYRARPVLDNEDRHRILQQLTSAEGLEKFLHTQYVGQKRFSLEGGESLIPLLDELIQRSGSRGVKEIVIGMAHRGRLNVLTNIIGKSPREIYEEFKGTRKNNPLISTGDVKYHMGFSSSVETPGGIIHVALGFNPSHLEIIGPVIGGSVRARQKRRKDKAGEQVIPVLIHGDAAFAGQGVVMENFNMSQARGFSTGGTVHIVINNQIGFTTSDPLDSRSTHY
ncbi:MAG: thiamine pyrophosphate-dependent enzyme, partial [bacterium]